MKVLLIKIWIVTFWAKWVSCTISGLSYMDPLNFGPYKTKLKDEDPCNPLYWYPKNIPEYCYHSTMPNASAPKPPIPLPIPVPLPPLPFPYPSGPPIMPSLYLPKLPTLPIPPQMPMFPVPNIPMFPPQPVPMLPPPSLPYGIPLEPTYPMLPAGGIPYPAPSPQYGTQVQAGFMPGIPGLVTQDGGINVLPFSDAYADLLEKHKQQLIRRKYERILEDYDDFPRKRRYRKHKRYRY